LSDEFEEVTDFKKIGLVVILVAVGAIASMVVLMPENFNTESVGTWLWNPIDLPQFEIGNENEIQSEPEPEPEIDPMDDPLYRQMIEEQAREEAIIKELQSKTEQNKQIAIDNNEPYYFDEETVSYMNNELFREPIIEERVFDIKPNYEKFIGQISEDDIVDIQNLECNNFNAGNETLISTDPEFDEIFSQRRSECTS